MFEVPKNASLRRCLLAKSSVIVILELSFWYLLWWGHVDAHHLLVELGRHLVSHERCLHLWVHHAWHHLSHLHSLLTIHLLPSAGVHRARHHEVHKHLLVFRSKVHVLVLIHHVELLTHHTHVLLGHSHLSIVVLLLRHWHLSLTHSLFAFISDVILSVSEGALVAILALSVYKIRSKLV